MKNVIIIPARYASTRYPGKPLELIQGADGKQRTLIEHSWRVGQESSNADAVFVATDDARIASEVEKFGGQVLMTPESCRNGTERCAACLEQLPKTVELIVNLQGDAPLTPAFFLDELIDSLHANPEFHAATPVLKCDKLTKERLLNDRRNNRVGGTTAVFSTTNKALYFSKEVIPYGAADVYHHVGVYAYRPDALSDYTKWREGKIEKSEGLEQLRFLENDAALLCVEMQTKQREFWEVNNPEDIEIVESILAKEAK